MKYVVKMESDTIREKKVVTCNEPLELSIIRDDGIVNGVAFGTVVSFDQKAGKAEIDIPMQLQEDRLQRMFVNGCFAYNGSHERHCEFTLVNDLRGCVL